MIVEKVLNTLILTLSVTTVLVTLISYLIYKVKQVPHRKVNESKRKTEGVFFKRFSPDESEEKTELVEEQKEVHPWLAKINTMPGYFAILATVIFLALILKNTGQGLLKNWEVYKRNEKVTALKEKNLLNMFEVDLFIESPSFKEFFPPSVLLNRDYKLAELRKKKIAVINHNVLNKPNKGLQQMAVDAWKSFLKKHQISYQELKEYSGLTQYDVVVIPQEVELNTKDEEYLLRRVEDSNLLFTGPVNSKGKSDKLNKEIGLELIGNENSDRYVPSVLNGLSSLDHNMPAGFLIDQAPIDPTYLVKQTGKDLILSGSHTGPLKEGEVYSRGFRRKMSEAKIVWTHLDPLDITNVSASQSFYQEEFFLNQLCWLGSIPIITPNRWQGRYQVAMTLSIDSEDEIEGSYEFSKFLSREKIPATFFIVSDMLRGDSRLTDQDEPFFEMASHTTDHEIITDHELNVQFDKIQNSRLAIEEAWGEKVKGFHPPEERFNKASINALLQNKMDYLVGDQRDVRLQPFFLVDQSLVYFTRMAKDDIFMEKDRRLVIAEHFFDVMKRDLEVAKNLGGYYYLNLHSQIIGKKIPYDSIEKLMDGVNRDEVWLTTMGNIALWWKERAKLNVLIGDKEIKIQNGNNHQVKDACFILSEDLLFHSSPRVKFKGERQFCVVELAAKEEVKLLINDGRETASP